MLRGIVLFGAGLALGYLIGHKRRPDPKPDPRRPGRPVVDAVDPPAPATKPPASSTLEPVTEAEAQPTEPRTEPRPEPKPRVADGRCSFVTARGTRCTRKALSGSDRCWQHDE